MFEQLLAELYRKQAEKGAHPGDSYLIAQDGQFLGRITDNLYDRESMSNQYGPYGSVYSPTSIFNQYSQYGSPYGVYSPYNQYSNTPPKLFIGGRFIGYITSNQYVSPRISARAFVYTLRNRIDWLLKGKVVESESEVRKLNRESYLEAADGTYLGSLVPNQFKQESIFNTFGPYGSQFSPISIFNQFGTYGNMFSQLSPYNEFTRTPPKIYVNGELVGYLTSNPHIQKAVHPDKILEWVQDNVSSFLCMMV